MFSNDSYDQDAFLSRSCGKQGEVDPIEQQRSALFGDSAGPFLGTMEELSRTKRRQRQRARELLFGSEHALSPDGELAEAVNGTNGAGQNRVWVGFDNWNGLETKPGEPAKPHADVTPVYADHSITPDEVAEFLRDERKARPPSRERKPVEAKNDSTRVVEPKPAVPAAAADPQPSNISHRWTLEELWGFVLKLDKLELELKDEPDFSFVPDGPPSEERSAPVAHAAPMPDGAEQPPVVPANSAPANSTPAEALTPPARPVEPHLPQGRTPEETFLEAMAVVESKSINTKERKSWAFRVIAALIVLGAVALLTLGVLQAIRLSENPAETPQLMNESLII